MWKVVDIEKLYQQYNILISGSLKSRYAELGDEHITSCLHSLYIIESTCKCPLVVWSCVWDSKSINTCRYSSDNLKSLGFAEWSRRKQLMPNWYGFLVELKVRQILTDGIWRRKQTIENSGCTACVYHLNAGHSIKKIPATCNRYTEIEYSKIF